jgi:nitrous oxidase accessory protein NosD
MGKLASNVIALSAILGLMLILAQVSYLVNAQPPVTLPVITISSDGSIQSSLSPSPIVKEGNTYIINENISGYGLVIQISNILFLGEGYTLQGTAQYNTNSGITIEGNGVSVENVSISEYATGIDVKGSSNTIIGCSISTYINGINVQGQSNLIIKNVISLCGGSGIELSGSNNTINKNLLIGGTDIQIYGNQNRVTENTITGNNIFDASKFSGGLSSYGINFNDPATQNTVEKNSIINNFMGIGLDKQTNLFYLNNFINNTYNVRLHIFADPSAPYSLNVFDNGSLGNYWGDYISKYPYAREIGNSGIYNTPYVINGNITDNYPLTSQLNIGTIPTPTSTPTIAPTSLPTPTPAVQEFPWLVIVPLLLSLFSVAIVVRHRKTANLNQ